MKNKILPLDRQDKFVKKHLNRVRPLCTLLGVLFLFYVAIKIVIVYFSALRVIEFAFLSTIFGLAPAFFFRRVFKFENAIGWLINSNILGILIIPFLFLFAGWIGINVVFVYSVWFIYICSFLGIISLFIFADEDAVVRHLSLRSVSVADVFFYILLLGYTLILTLRNFEKVYAGWDAFTFWGLDSKYIYLFNQLRDSTLDVFGSFRYTSYYPIYYSIIYDIYGAVVEQYANWINVFLNFLALLLIYNQVRQKNFLQKTLIVTMLIITSYGAINAAFMFYMYADMLAAFNMLLFMVILTNDNAISLESYSGRTLLLLLLALSLYFIKSPNLSLTFMLIATWIFYDLNFLLKEWRFLIRRTDFIISVMLFILFYLMRFNYFSAILRIGSDTPVTDLLTPDISSLYSSFVYAKGLLVWLIQGSPHLVGLWLFGLASIVLIKRGKFDKRHIFLYSVSLFVFMFYCFIYILNQSSLSSGGPIRYTTIVMYLIPLMYSGLEITTSHKTSLVLIVTLCFVSLYFIIQTMTPMPLNKNFELSTGAYSVYLPEYSAVAENALKISDPDVKILIADDDSETDSAGNMNIPAIYIRYFLMSNSVGGQYFFLPMEDLYDYALKYNADYILLISYDSTFDYCENILYNGPNYLIKISKDNHYKKGECIFSKEDVFQVHRK